MTTAPDDVAGALVAALKAVARPENRAGMARFGINTARALGVSVVDIRKMARGHRRDMPLANALWATGIHEARILATIVADHRQLDRATAERWVGDADSWDLVDQCCGNLFAHHPDAPVWLADWVKDEREYVRRAGFTLMAALAVHAKAMRDEDFLPFLPMIAAGSSDPRNFVKKAVNWALRQIGKRSLDLLPAALALAGTLGNGEDRTGRWIGKDAARELKDPKLSERLRVRQMRTAGKPAR